MRTPVATLLAVADIGGKLGVTKEHGLLTRLPRNCPAELKDAILQHKSGLLALLSGPPFVVVRSALLPDEWLLWTPGEEGRQLLISHGAPPGRIYTRDELAALVRQRTDPATLRTVHAAKRTFDGRLPAV